MAMKRQLIPTEEQEHLALMQWISLVPVLRELIFHIPNGGYRNPKEAAKFKRLGVKKGMSDLFLPLPTKWHHGLFLELKRKINSKVSKEQSEWLEKMKSFGYSTHVAYGFDHAKEILMAYLAEYVK
jgi:hypothetical protein